MDRLSRSVRNNKSGRIEIVFLSNQPILVCSHVLRLLRCPSWYLPERLDHERAVLEDLLFRPTCWNVQISSPRKSSESSKLDGRNRTGRGYLWQVAILCKCMFVYEDAMLQEFHSSLYTISAHLWSKQSKGRWKIRVFFHKSWIYISLPVSWLEPMIGLKMETTTGIVKFIRKCPCMLGRILGQNTINHADKITGILANFKPTFLPWSPNNHPLWNLTISVH